MGVEAYPFARPNPRPPEGPPLNAPPLLDFLMGEGSLHAESLKRVSRPHRYSEDRYDIWPLNRELALTLVRTFAKEDGTIETARKTVGWIELNEFMDSTLLRAIEAWGALDRQGRLIPQDKMLKTLHNVADLFRTTPITEDNPECTKSDDLIYRLRTCLRRTT